MESTRLPARERIADETVMVKQLRRSDYNMMRTEPQLLEGRAGRFC
jgi:hypothetical protein